MNILIGVNDTQNNHRKTVNMYTVRVYRLYALAILLGFTMTHIEAQSFFEFPKRTGSYNVGMRIMQLEDMSRQESYTPEVNIPRRLMVTAWYPADETLTELQPYAPGYLMDAIKSYYKGFEVITDKDLEELDSIRVQVVPDAPVSKKKSTYPLIIFSHGYYGSRFYCSALCQELASHGSIVVAVDHTYDCGITQLQDGTIATFKKITDAQENSDEFYAAFQKRLDIRIADIRFIIDTIKTLSLPVDTNHIGIFGHSLGAEAALQAAASDKRVKAVVGMDAFPIGQVLPDTFNTPCLMLKAELTDWAKLETSEHQKTLIAQQLSAYDKLCGPAVVLKDADHIVFSDFALFSKLELSKKLPTQGHMFAIGSLDGVEAIEKIGNYLVIFFVQQLA